MREQLLQCAKKRVPVTEMAKLLNMDFSVVMESYVKFSAEDRDQFPLSLLITKEWLETELTNSTVAEICRKIRTSPSVIKNYCKKYGIQRKPMIRDILTKDKIYEHFVKQRMSDREIAALYGCSLETVKKQRSKYGIGVGTRTNAENHMSIELFHRIFVEYGFTIQQLAQMLGCSHYAVLNMQKQYAKGNSVLAKEIGQRKKYYAFQNLIDILLEKIPPVELLQLLHENTLAEIAEEKGILPEPIVGVDTFSVEWFRIILRSMTPSDIMKTYHVGKAYVLDMIKTNNLEDITPANSMDEALVRKLYCDNRWSDEEIARVMNVPVYAVVCLRKNQGIKRSKQYTIAQRLPIDDFRNLYITEDLTISQIADMYDVSTKSVSTLKAQYAEQCSALASHKARGAEKERVEYLKKKLKFKGFSSGPVK